MGNTSFITHTNFEHGKSENVVINKDFYNTLYKIYETIKKEKDNDTGISIEWTEHGGIGWVRYYSYEEQRWRSRKTRIHKYIAFLSCNTTSKISYLRLTYDVGLSSQRDYYYFRYKKGLYFYREQRDERWHMKIPDGFIRILDNPPEELASVISTAIARGKSLKTKQSDLIKFGEFLCVGDGFIEQYKQRKANK